MYRARHSTSSNLITVEDVKNQPAYAPDFLVNTDAINRKYAKRRVDPRRVWTGTFHAPVDASEGQLDNISKERCERCVTALDKRGWEFLGRIDVKGPFAAYDLVSGMVLLDQREYRIQAGFELRKPQPVRIEIPHSVIRQDSEQTITLKEALRATR